MAVDRTELNWRAATKAVASRDPQALIGAAEGLKQAMGAQAPARVPVLQPIDVAAIRAAIAAAPAGLPPAWPALALAGAIFEPGTLSIIAAPTSAGKTTLTLAQALAWLRDPALTGILVWWSSEMDVHHLLERLVGMIAGESMIEVERQERAGAVTSAVYAAWQEVAALASRIVMIDEPMTADAYGRAIEALAQTRPILAAVVDFGQEMMPVDFDHPLAARYSRNREQEVAATTVLLAETARKLHIPVIMAAQLNRQVNQKGGEYVPDLSHLRESGRIEQRATLVLALRNAEMSKAVAGQGGGAKTKDMIYRAWPDRALAKAREGALAACAAKFPNRTLVEAFVLKSRIHGGVGNVVPLVMDGRTGQVDQLAWRYAAGPVGKGSGGGSTSSGGQGGGAAAPDESPDPEDAESSTGLEAFFGEREPGEDDIEDWV